MHNANDYWQIYWKMLKKRVKPLFFRANDSDFRVEMINFDLWRFATSYRLCILNITLRCSPVRSIPLPILKLMDVFCIFWVYAHPRVGNPVSIRRVPLESIGFRVTTHAAASSECFIFLLKNHKYSFCFSLYSSAKKSLNIFSRFIWNKLMTF